jgi:single-strand DNA-binding protein
MTYMQMNRVEVAGHLAKKPEVRHLPSGIPVANVRLGQTYRFQDSSHQWQEHTNWHSLSFYGDLSKVAFTFDKGENIFVEGTIEQREFTPKDGAKRVVNEIIVRHCHLIAPARGAVSIAAAEPKAAAQNGESIPDFEGAPSHDDDWPVR